MLKYPEKKMQGQAFPDKALIRQYLIKYKSESQKLIAFHQVGQHQQLSNYQGTGSREHITNILSPSQTH